MTKNLYIFLSLNILRELNSRNAGTWHINRSLVPQIAIAYTHVWTSKSNKKKIERRIEKKKTHTNG